MSEEDIKIQKIQENIEKMFDSDKLNEIKELQFAKKRFYIEINKIELRLKRLEN